MIRILQFAIFLGIFSSIYFLLNFFVFFKFFKMFSFKRNYLFYIILGVLSISLIVSTMIVSTYYNFFTRALYALASLWMGIVFLLCSSLIIYCIIRIFWKISPKTSGKVILIGVAIITIVSIINAQMIFTETVKISEFPAKLKAVHLTDIHTGTIHKSPFLKRMVNKINDLEPDIVFITGDLVSGNSKIRSEMFHEFERLNSPTYFVNGNHEIYDGPEEIQNALKEVNIKTLRDEVIDFKGIQIIGLDYSQKKEYINEVLPKLKISEDKPSIVLMHSAPKIEYPKVNLILSGHTHGGQISPFNLIHKIFTPYVNGLYKLEHGHIYVSPGTGTWGPPMRLGSKNEITLLDLG